MHQFANTDFSKLKEICKNNSNKKDDVRLIIMLIFSIYIDSSSSQISKSDKEFFDFVRKVLIHGPKYNKIENVGQVFRYDVFEDYLYFDFDYIQKSGCGNNLIEDVFSNDTFKRVCDFGEYKTKIMKSSTGGRVVVCISTTCLKKHVLEMIGDGVVE